MDILPSGMLIVVNIAQFLNTSPVTLLDFTGSDQNIGIFTDSNTLQSKKARGPISSMELGNFTVLSAVNSENALRPILRNVPSFTSFSDTVTSFSETVGSFPETLSGSAPTSSKTSVSTPVAPLNAKFPTEATSFPMRISFMDCRISFHGVIPSV